MQPASEKQPSPALAPKTWEFSPRPIPFIKQVTSSRLPTPIPGSWVSGKGAGSPPGTETGLAREGQGLLHKGLHDHKQLSMETGPRGIPDCCWHRSSQQAEFWGTGRAEGAPQCLQLSLKQPLGRHATQPPIAGLQTLPGHPVHLHLQWKEPFQNEDGGYPQISLVSGPCGGPCRPHSFSQQQRKGPEGGPGPGLPSSSSGGPHVVAAPPLL